MASAQTFHHPLGLPGCSALCAWWPHPSIRPPISIDVMRHTHHRASARTRVRTRLRPHSRGACCSWQCSGFDWQWDEWLPAVDSIGTGGRVDGWSTCLRSAVVWVRS